MNDVFIPLYAATLGGVLLMGQSILMLTVGAYRNTIKKGIGTDGDLKLERLVRRHGNFAENAAIFLSVLTIYELINGQTGLGLWVGLLFGVGRIAHAIGFSNNAGSHLVNAEGGRKVFVAMRALGAMLTVFPSIILGGALAYSMFNTL